MNINLAQEKMSILARSLLFIFSLIMVSVSIYLSFHYYEIHFPKSLVSGSMCDISSYWNCDSATLSPLSNILGLPTAVFGFIVGLIFLVGSCISNSKLEKTNYSLAIINALGCLTLLSYSLFSLGALCPGCTIYYVCSFIIAGLYWKSSASKPSFDYKIIGIYTLFALAISASMFQYSKTEEEKLESISKRFLDEFRSSANYESFDLESPFKIASASENFSEAPLRISLFSDFQCPVCKVFAEDILPKILRHYHGRINFQYFFYPMDSACNHNISQPMHPLACEAAYLSSCLEKDFANIHDKIYEHQNELSNQFFQKLAYEHKVSACFNDSKAKDLVESMIFDGDKIGVQATPTMIVNGRKLEGLLPLKLLIVLFDDAIKNS